MNATRWVVVGALFGLLVVGGAPAATAELEGTNGCQASGAFREGGFTVDARAVGDALVVVPRSDTVDWQGSVAAPPGAYSGSISVELPKPFGTLEIDSWAGNSQTMSNAGTHEYDLPSLVPASSSRSPARTSTRTARARVRCAWKWRVGRSTRPSQPSAWLAPLRPVRACWHCCGRCCGQWGR